MPTAIFKIAILAATAQALAKEEQTLPNISRLSRSSICKSYTKPPLDTINKSHLIRSCDSLSIELAKPSIQKHESASSFSQQDIALCKAYCCTERSDSAITICTRAFKHHKDPINDELQQITENLSTHYLKLNKFDSASKYTALTMNSLATSKNENQSLYIQAKKESLLLRHSYILAKLNLDDSAISIILPQYHKILFQRQLEWLVSKRYTPKEIRSNLESSIRSVDWSVSEKSDSNSYYRKLLGANHHPSSPDSGRITLFKNKFFLRFPSQATSNLPTHEDYIQEYLNSDFFFYLYCRE